jgi:hypothetical protein
VSVYSRPVAQARSALGIHSRWHPDDVDKLNELRRNLIAEKLAAYIERELAAAPRLTDEQINRLTALLRPGAGQSGKARTR